MSAPVIIVHLRRPTNKRDARTDPLYEFGSFGLTGCHDTNVLSDRSAAGCRLAFAQGGKHGFRLVMLTPPVDVRELAHVREAFWSPADMPLRYETAPVLIENDGSSDVVGMRDILASVNRDTLRQAFSSAFRSRKQPLDSELGAAVVRAWNSALERGAQRAVSYWEALPSWDANFVDRDRHGTYQKQLMKARGEPSHTAHDDDTDSTCRPRKATPKTSPGPTKPRRC